MKTLPQIKTDSKQEAIIYRKIRQYFDEVFFNYMHEVLKPDFNRFENSSGLASAIKIGKIKYINGTFVAKNMSNKLAKEIEALGGKYSKAYNGYRLSVDKMPPELVQAVSEYENRNQDRVKKMLHYLDGIEENKDYITQNLNFDIEVERIGENLEAQLKRSLATIDTIPPEMTSYQLAQIAQNYTYNLNYYINKWTQNEIFSLRKDLNKFVLSGVRAENLEEIIKHHQDVSENKARFLARQETKLLVAEYRKNRFKQAGVTKYRWSTVLDGRERELHKKLHGRIFSWDNPPIIDEVTGQRGNPGEAYNCRCMAIPIVED